jgi:uncharacterized protein (DUF433 family)
MNLARLQRITVEEGKCGGRPCIRGLRMRVTDVLELLGSEASFEEILEDYPFLEREDILAAIDYAAHQTDHVVIEASSTSWTSVWLKPKTPHSANMPSRMSELL